MLVAWLCATQMPVGEDVGNEGSMEEEGEGDGDGVKMIPPFVVVVDGIEGTVRVRDGVENGGGR